MPRLRAEVALVPGRKFHRHGGIKRRFLPTPAQAGAHAEGAMVGRKIEISGGIVVAFISGIMKQAAQNPIQRNLVAWIEQMINAERWLCSIAGECFCDAKTPLPIFPIVARVPASGPADPKVRKRG